MQNQLALRRQAETAGTIPHLDGIRGLAIFLVACGHLFWDIYIFKITWIGLNLFFILSGYLITRCLFHYQSYSAQNYFRNFYARRFLRIFPLYYAVLIFFFLVLPLISQQVYSHYTELNDTQGYYWGYASNWSMIINGMPHQPVFFHFWSLAVEEQFYLVWPILFLVCYSSRVRYILIAVILGLSVGARIITETPFHAYVSSLTAAEPLLLGCLLCILQQDGLLGRISKGLNVMAILCVLFLAFVFFKDSGLGYTNILLMKYGYSAIDIILCSIVCVAFISNSLGAKVKQFFSMKWLRWLGKYSYSIYVFHWIILQTMIFKLEAAMNNQFPGSVAYILSRIVGIVLTLVVSYFSYHYFEKRFLALKKYFAGDTRGSWDVKWNYISHRLLKIVRR